jgi:2-hydroxy-6-oxonona-2,4-dienedioate hydrolase
VERVVAAGGSGGARDMIVFTLLYPEKVRKLATWCIVGGAFSTMSLANVYIMNELRTVRALGIEGVVQMQGAAGFGWAQLCEVNPRNKERLLAIGAVEFERVMTRWLDAFIPKPNEAIPGVPDWEFAQIRVPTLIVRGGAGDYDHPRRTSLEVHALIEGSRLIEPPWPEDAWEQRAKQARAGKDAGFHFWIHGAPALLDFIG